jgi:hypothetical protein
MCGRRRRRRRRRRERGGTGDGGRRAGEGSGVAVKEGSRGNLGGDGRLIGYRALAGSWGTRGAGREEKMEGGGG